MNEQIDFTELARKNCSLLGINEKQFDLLNIFVPKLFIRWGEARNRRISFAHYTTAATAIEFFRNGELWLRNARLMNDHSEIKYAVDLLKPCNDLLMPTLDRVYNKLFSTTIEDVGLSIAGSIERMISGSWIACLSEHDPGSVRSSMGRLSIWRAYGGKAGIAIIFNAKLMLEYKSDASGFILPVHYLTSDELQEYFKELAGRLDANMSLLSNYTKEEFDDILPAFYQATLLGTKHPGFHEEQEWRVIHRPDTMRGKAFPLKSKIEAVRGIPQIVHKLELQKGLKFISGERSFHELIDQIIIGPCDQPDEIRDALISELSIRQFPAPEKLITISNIPLRHAD